MKKRMAICALVLIGAVCPLTACNPPVIPEPPVHEHTYGTTWSWNGEYHWYDATCGDTDGKKDYGAHTFGGGNRCAVCGYERTPAYLPGETVTDREIRAAILGSLKAHEFAHASVTYDVDLTGSFDGEPFDYRESGERNYDPASDTESVPVFVKLAKNVLVYAEGEIVKTETGYGMTVASSAVLDKMLGDVSAAVAALKPGFLPVGLANSVADLLWQPSMQNLLETMLYGITAEELTALFGETLPEGTVSVLPEATSDMGAFDYLWVCLRSPALATAIAELYFEGAEDSSGLNAMLSGGIASAPLEFVWNALFQKSFVQSEILAEIETLRAGLPEIGQSGTVGCNFNEDYALTDLQTELLFDGVSLATEAFSLTLDGTIYLEVIA